VAPSPPQPPMQLVTVIVDVVSWVTSYVLYRLVSKIAL